MSNEVRNEDGDRFVGVFMPRPFERYVMELAEDGGCDDVGPELPIFVLQEMLNAALIPRADQMPVSFEEAFLRGLAAYREAIFALNFGTCECPACMDARRRLN